LNDDELLKGFFLEAFPNPERKDCPDENTLRACAEDRLPPGNLTLPHVASCSECYAEYLHYREDWKEQSAHQSPSLEKTPSLAVIAVAPASSRRLRWALAAGILIAVGSGVFLVREHQPAGSSGSSVASSDVPSVANVDLFNAVTARGIGTDDEPAPLRQVSLPSSVLKLNVTLPRFSESGPYTIIVAKDRAGKDIVARGRGDAVKLDGKVSVSLLLDLRRAAPGMYFLATVRGSDNGTYYYPLTVE
jgi:hypothetical protein